MTLGPQVRVLQIVGSLGMGGAETWLMELLRYWQKDGSVQMDFLLTSGRPDIFDEEAKDLGAKIFYIPFKRREIVKFTNEFRKVLSKYQYHAIHDHADYASGWHFILGFKCLPKVRVAHVHNSWLHISEYYGVTTIRRVSLKVGKYLVSSLASHVCGTSSEVLRQYGFYNNQSSKHFVQKLHCGVSTEKFCAHREKARNQVLKELGVSLDAKIILCVGRIDQAMEFNHPQNQKNSWLALHIGRELVTRDKSILFLMAGSGDRFSQYREKIREWDLSDNIRMLGIRHDIPELMRASNVLLFPSAQEGLGMVAVEAQAAALPVLASDTVPDEAIVVPDLFHSLPLDTPIEGWVNKLLSIIKLNRPSLDECQLSVRSSDFSIETSAARLERIYKGELSACTGN